MRTALKIAKRALPSASIYFCIFLALTIVFTFLAGKDQQEMFEVSKKNMIIEDKDHSVLSNTLTEYLAKENTILTGYEEERLSEWLFYGKVEYVIYIPEGFEEKFLSGEEKTGLERQSIKANVAFLDEKVELFSRLLRAELTLGKEPEAACEAVLAASEKQVEVVVTEGKNGELTLKEPGFYFFSYLSYILPAILIMIIGPIMNAFYKKDVKMRTDCGKTSIRKQNMSIIAGIVVVAAVILAVLILLGAVIYGRFFTVETYLYGMLNSFLFLLVSVAIAVLIGVLVRGDNALIGASNVIAMGMAFICGVFVPVELLPDGVTKFAEFLPASWYMKNVNLLFESSMAEQIGTFFGNCGIILVFAVALFCAVLVVVKKKRVA